MSVNRRPSLPTAEYGLLRRIWSHRLFRRMLARQAIDLEKAARHETQAMLFRALDNCSHCTQKETCREWLENTESRASYIRFCPNSETIEALRVATS